MELAGPARACSFFPGLTPRLRDGLPPTSDMAFSNMVNFAYFDSDCCFLKHLLRRNTSQKRTAAMAI
jgi:hypothetical protein